MIDKEFGKKWIEALRSGKFAENKCCCLGVACVVAKLPVVDSAEWLQFGADKDTHYSPWELGRFGIDEKGTLANGKVLSELNDAGASFEEIAKLIEEEIQCQA